MSTDVDYRLPETLCYRKTETQISRLRRPIAPLSKYYLITNAIPDQSRQTQHVTPHGLNCTTWVPSTPISLHPLVLPDLHNVTLSILRGNASGAGHDGVKNRAKQGGGPAPLRAAPGVLDGGGGKGLGGWPNRASSRPGT